MFICEVYGAWDEVNEEHKRNVISSRFCLNQTKNMSLANSPNSYFFGPMRNINKNSSFPQVIAPMCEHIWYQSTFFTIKEEAVPFGS